MNERTKRPIRVFHGLDVYDLPPETPARQGRGDSGVIEDYGGAHVEVEIMGQRRTVAVESDALAADRLWSALATAEATIEEDRRHNSELQDQIAEMAALVPGDGEPRGHSGVLFVLREMRHLWDIERARAAERPQPAVVLVTPKPMSAEEQRAYAEGYSPPKPAAQETPRERDPAVWAAAFADFHGRSLAAAYSAADGSPAERMATAIANVDGAACARVADAAALAAEGTSAPEPGETPRTKEPGWRSP